MKTFVRFAAAVSVCVALLGASSLMAGRKPVPPAPVLCGCACPEGIVVVHAPDEDSCDDVCANACAQEM